MQVCMIAKCLRIGLVADNSKYNQVELKQLTTEYLETYDGFVFT